MEVSENSYQAELAKINSTKGVTVKDVPAEEFIKSFAAFLKKTGKFKVPEWGQFVKTTCFRELSPYKQDWLYVRAAAVARQLYLKRSIGINTLRSHFGGKQRAGVNTEHHRKASAKIIRHCMQQLQELGMVGVVQIKDDNGKTIETNGREITKKGVQDMDRIACQLKKAQK